MIPSKLARMRASLGPINPSDAPIMVPFRLHHVHQSWYVMLVHVAWWEAIVFKDWIVLRVRHDLKCELSMYLEPLGALSPVRDVYHWPHFRVVAASAELSWVVERADET